VGYVFEHILVMESVLGRNLTPTEHVHHKNGKRDDNRPENLELWRVKDPPGIRAADYHCAGCRCSSTSTGSRCAVGAASEETFDSSDIRSGPTSTVALALSRTAGRDRRWKGGRSTHASGYILIWAPDHPRARSTPYVFEHILVMEKLLGRLLEPHERVHHRNGRRDDNRPENLELWRLRHDPKGIRASDYHCSGCACADSDVGNELVCDTHSARASSDAGAEGSEGRLTRRGA